jgi:hypothetical protein
MIAFDLICANGHLFEGWFDSLDSYEEQNRKKLISCPQCESCEIKKILSPVSVKSQSRALSSDTAGPVDYRRLAMEVWDHIQSNYEDTGSDFAKEALKIHYGVSEQRNIRGTATENEEKVLKDEGIHFFKVPALKGDKEEN